MIALYKGISPYSRLIRWWSRGAYSHAAWIDPDTGSCYEAWTDGVRMVPSYEFCHTPGTHVDFFSTPATSEQCLGIRHFYEDALGKPYDWRGILHFATRRPERPGDQNRWFCSELLFAACRAAGVHLLVRVEPYKVFPCMLAWSPLVVHVITAICGTPDKPGVVCDPGGSVPVGRFVPAAPGPLCSPHNLGLQHAGIVKPYL